MRTLFLAMCVMGMAGCSHSRKNVAELHPCLPDEGLVYNGNTHKIECVKMPKICADEPLRFEPCQINPEDAPIPAKKANGIMENVDGSAGSGKVAFDPKRIIRDEDAAIHGYMSPAKKANKTAYASNPKFVAIVVVKHKHGVHIVGRGMNLTMEYGDKDPETVDLLAHGIADYLNSLGDNPEFPEAK